MKKMWMMMSLLLLAIGFIVIQESYGYYYDCPEDDRVYVNHTISNGFVPSMCSSPDINSLIVNIIPHHNGEKSLELIQPIIREIAIEIPNQIVPSFRSDCQNEEFIVLVDVEEVYFKYNVHTGYSRIITIPFDKDSKQIEIIGTYVYSPSRCLESMDLKSVNIPPKKQASMGILPADVVCNNDLQIAIKSSDDTPACLTSISLEKLVQRSWAKYPVDH